MAEIIDLDFYRKFRVALPIRQQKAKERKEGGKSSRRARKPRKTIQRPIYRNHTNIPDNS